MGVGRDEAETLRELLPNVYAGLKVICSAKTEPVTPSAIRIS